MPSAKFEIKRKCQYCGNTFIAKTLDSKYCSRRCSQRAYDQREAAKKRMSQLNDIVENIPEARDYISVHEAVAMFGISRDTIYRLIRKGNVPAINIGQRLTRISKSKLSEMFPLRTEPIDRSRALPKSYHLEPEDCYTICEISKTYGIDDSTVYAHIRKIFVQIVRDILLRKDFFLYLCAWCNAYYMLSTDFAGELDSDI